jgi:hypothetical protein
MVEKKAGKAKKAKARRERTERRFEPEQTQTNNLAVIGGMVGALGLGAGVYSQWIQDPPLGFASWLVAGGALVLGGALWFGDAGAVPVRVGDAGLAIEKGTELSRLAWCDIERIYTEKNELVIKGDQLTLTLPLKAHARAAAWVLSEAARRLPDVLDVHRKLADELPKPRETDGTVVKIDSLQIAGRNCAASDKPIAFERDARLCPNCAEVYHKDHVPKKCATCENDLGERAVKV